MDVSQRQASVAHIAEGVGGKVQRPQRCIVACKGPRRRAGHRAGASAAVVPVQLPQCQCESALVTATHQTCWYLVAPGSVRVS